MSAIDAGIHAIRAGRHLCDEALRYLWTGTSRRTHFFLPVSRPNSLAIRLIGLDFVRLFSFALFVSVTTVAIITVFVYAGGELGCEVLIVSAI